MDVKYIIIIEKYQERVGFQDGEAAALSLGDGGESRDDGLAVHARLTSHGDKSTGHAVAHPDAVESSDVESNNGNNAGLGELVRNDCHSTHAELAVSRKFFHSRGRS